MPELTDAQKVLRNDTGMRMAAALETLASAVEPSTVIAPEYDATQTYAVGDLVLYHDVLYRCTTAITTPEAWTAAHWTATSVTDEYRPAAEQDLIDAGKEKAGLGLTGASVGDLVRVKTVDANGKPTSWSHVPLCDIVTNENLLDNWYFVGGGSQLGDGVFPINQPGQATYVTQGPCIDRWRMRGSNNGSVALASAGDGVVITLNTNTGRGNSYKSLDQLLDKNNLQGKTVTLSCLVTGYVNDGADWLYLGIWSTDNSSTHTHQIGAAEFTAPGLVSVTVDIPSQVSDTYLKAGVLIRNSAEHTGSVSIKIQAIKLELGSYQTLAHNDGTEENPNWVLNELPNYGEELAKCRRKYIKINKIPLNGFTNSAGKYCYVDTGFEMDGTVTLTVSALGTLITPAGGKALSGVTVQASMSPHVCLKFELETVDSTVGYRQACVADPVIELSTE